MLALIALLAGIAAFSWFCENVARPLRDRDYQEVRQ